MTSLPRLLGSAIAYIKTAVFGIQKDTIFETGDYCFFSGLHMLLPSINVDRKERVLTLIKENCLKVFAL